MSRIPKDRHQHRPRLYLLSPLQKGSEGPWYIQIVVESLWGGSGSLATSLTAANTSTTGVSWSSLSGTPGFSLVCSFSSGPGLADDLLPAPVSPLVIRLLSSAGGSLLGIFSTVLCSLSVSFVSGKLAQIGCNDFLFTLDSFLSEIHACSEVGWWDLENLDSSLFICFDKGSFLLAPKGLTSPPTFMFVNIFRFLECMSANHVLFKYGACVLFVWQLGIPEIEPIYGI